MSMSRVPFSRSAFWLVTVTSGDSRNETTSGCFDRHLDCLGIIRRRRLRCQGVVKLLEEHRKEIHQEVKCETLLPRATLAAIGLKVSSFYPALSRSLVAQERIPFQNLKIEYNRL